MESREAFIVNRGTLNSGNLFVRWVVERKEFLIPFFVLFVVVDPLMTYIGTNGFNVREGNLIVSTLTTSENGWMIWLVLKIVFGVVGTIFMFSAYYVIHTERLSPREKEKAIIFEYGAWSFLLCFIFIIILHWATIIIAD